MDVYNVILKRRSIRRFKQDKIPIDILEKLVNSARVSASAANLQPLEYIIITNNHLPGVDENRRSYGVRNLSYNSNVMLFPTAKHSRS